MRNNNFYNHLKYIFTQGPFDDTALVSVVCRVAEGGGGLKSFWLSKLHIVPIYNVLRHSNVTDETYFCGFRCTIFEGGRLSKKTIKHF